MNRLVDTLRWELKRFEELSATELYESLRLRAEVFVVEQDVAYNDLDGRDSASLHLLGFAPDGKLVAYLRLLPLGLCGEPYGSMGRVVVDEHYRGQGIGRQLTLRGLEAYDSHIGRDVPMRIHAQAYLQAFYEQLGFVAVGPVADYEGRPHVTMERRAVNR